MESCSNKNRNTNEENEFIPFKDLSIHTEPGSEQANRHNPWC